MNLLHSFIDPIRDRLAPLQHTSNFRSTGQITPEEFIAAGDFLVYKFPSWSWSDAATPDKRVSYFPAGKQYLVTRGVPCKRRVKGGDAEFLGGGEEEQIVRDMLAGPGEGDVGGENDGWLKAGGGNGDLSKSAELRMKDVRTVDDDGKVGEKVDEEEEIPDMEDEEDDEEAIIRDNKGSSDAEGCVSSNPSLLLVCRIH
jgi:ubiquitin-like-conjugating enzyme ATG3